LSQPQYISPIIPVLDLMIGQIVLAEGGNRDQYRPVDTKLTRSPQPLDVARAMFQQTGCDWVCLADIDSFSGAAPAWHVYGQLLEAGFGVWVDATKHPNLPGAFCIRPTKNFKASRLPRWDTTKKRTLKTFKPRNRHPQSPHKVQRRLACA